MGPQKTRSGVLMGTGGFFPSPAAGGVQTVVRHAPRTLKSGSGAHAHNGPKPARSADCLRLFNIRTTAAHSVFTVQRTARFLFSPLSSSPSDPPARLRADTMASSGMQLIGFLLALVGLAATISAIMMVQWKKQSHGKAFRNYEGLWMSCSGSERTTCDFHDSVLKLSSEVQATRAVLMLSIFLSAVAVVVSTVGMKCTHFMDDKAPTKAAVALIGGVMFMMAGSFRAWLTSSLSLLFYLMFTDHHHHLLVC
ncbi:claudin-7-B-like isoform X2 [Betta splendens]|uniref:Claudin-7-B-like isoform X2 n=1 Tax=Betta splendens TaxID=158456 RepID=A0A6P7MEE4_BETSP|nr:claudin-7-B-like isoform X2 [Betta splendens]